MNRFIENFPWIIGGIAMVVALLYMARYFLE